MPDADGTPTEAEYLEGRYPGAQEAREAALAERQREESEVLLPGRRIYDEHPYQLGDYAHIAGHWVVRPPLEGFPNGNLDLHEVVEHDDDTITVLGSILRDYPDGCRFHAYLERGVWRILDDTVTEPPA